MLDDETSLTATGMLAGVAGPPIECSPNINVPRSEPALPEKLDCFQANFP